MFVPAAVLNLNTSVRFALVMIEREASGRPKIGSEWSVEEARSF
jgi:hypothetical protein